MKKILLQLSILLTLLWLAVCPAQAQTTDTISVHSPSMNKQIKNIIILPASYGERPLHKYPVVYLLHGYGCNYTTWLTRIKPDLAQVVSGLDMILVCPDGQNSWYWDSPEDSAYRYETYISKELIPYIDKHYATIAGRNGRAISGFSMGGHGGLWLGFRHPDLFGACGSMSGGVDIRPFPNNWEMKKHLGNYAENPARWNEYTVTNQIPYNLSYGPLAIIIDCGTSDFFYQVNCELHEKLLANNIFHDFISRPGKHNDIYWKNAIDYQLLFFRKALGK